MAEKISLARLKKFGKTFELSVDPDKALEYKDNKADLREVLHSDDIFSDVKKGQLISDDELQQAFKTTDKAKIADIIIREGEIQLTAEHRAQEREQKKKYLINLIHTQAVNPQTKLPHPPTRIEAALEQAKVNIDYNKTIEEQLDTIIQKLRPIIPISIEKVELQLTIPATYTGKAYQYVKNNSKILKEDWNSDGSWSVKTEIPAGIQHEFMDTLNSMTHGEIQNE